MYTSPIIAKGLVESRQHNLRAQAREARLAREAANARLAEREAEPVRRPVPARRWRLGLAGLFGAN